MKSVKKLSNWDVAKIKATIEQDPNLYVHQENGLYSYRKLDKYQEELLEETAIQDPTWLQVLYHYSAHMFNKLMGR